MGKKSRQKRKAKRASKAAVAPQQTPFQRLAGIASKAVDAAATIPGPVGMIASAVSGIKNLINVEHKFSDTQEAINAVTSGSVQLLTGVNRGTGDNDRIGKSVLGQSMDLKYNAYLTQQAGMTGAQRSVAVRHSIILDKEIPGAAYPTLGEIYSFDNIEDPTTALLNKTNSDRFMVIRDNRYMLHPYGASGKCYSEHISLKDIHQQYKVGSTGAAAPDLTQGHLYSVVWSGWPAGQESTAPGVVGTCRYNYVDN